VASTIKPVVYAAALERGFHPCTYLDNDKKSYAEFDGWTPDNFDRDSTGGEVAMWYALCQEHEPPHGGPVLPHRGGHDHPGAQVLGTARP
jgi:membrane carboxypeptidase/penicillin-binding protein PbpC